ncbi:papain-like cysteine protease family protein [Parashewanella tropica]|uniref:papain-like cysteine protease family protein n=1 Tax=Parashewanella tropica TaxID=2547970 RepID=UPI001059AF81|nr:papain-like cysteine protease family protein [Parashewanella tropica]
MIIPKPFNLLFQFRARNNLTAPFECLGLKAEQVQPQKTTVRLKSGHVQVYKINGTMTPPKISDTVAIFHNVEYIHQGHVNLCLDACIEMYKVFFDLPHRLETKPISQSTSKLVSNPRFGFYGLTSLDLDLYFHPKFKFHPLNNCVYRFPQDEKLSLKESLIKGLSSAPMILEISKTVFGRPVLYHEMLIVGLSENHVILHCPWRGGNIVKPIAWLEAKLRSHSQRNRIYQVSLRKEQRALL